MRITDVLVNCKLASSRKEAERLIKAGAVYAAGERIKDIFEDDEGEGLYLLRVGKPHNKRWCYVQGGKPLDPHPDRNKQSVFLKVDPPIFYETDRPHSTDYVVIKLGRIAV